MRPATGSSDRLRQRFTLEIGSVLQVPDRRLEKPKASPRPFFGVPIALQFIFGLQESPFVRIDGFKVGYLVFAIGDWLWREQSRIKPAESRLRVVARRVAAGWRTRRCGRDLDLSRTRRDVARPGILSTARDDNRERNGTEGQQF